MEREIKKKRGRAKEEVEEMKKYCPEKSAKRQQEDKIMGFEEELKTWEWSNINNNSTMILGDSGGVFDFPWLKEGVISKSEELMKLEEDAFSCSLDIVETSACSELAGCHCQTPALWDFPDDENFTREDQNIINEWALEGEDGIWSSLLSQPLSTGFNIERGV